MAIAPHNIITRKDGKAYPIWRGVLNEAHGSKTPDHTVVSITTKMIQLPTPENGQLAVMHATATMSSGQIYEGIGDASPESVESRMVPHLLRLAETRAKGRALRDALNIGEAMFEELGPDACNGNGTHQPAPPAAQNGSQPATSGLAQSPAGAPLATPAQVKAIYAKARANGLHPEDIEGRCIDTYGRLPADLTKREASTVLDSLA